VSVLYQSVDTANRLWPTSVAPRRGFIPVGQRVARSLSERWPAVPPRETWFLIGGSRPSTRAQGEGQPGRCPFKLGKWTPRRATLLCSSPCRCSAQSPLGQGIEPFFARPFFRSVHSPFSAPPLGR